MPSFDKELPLGHLIGAETPVRSSAELGAVIREQRKRLALKQLDLAGLGNTGHRFSDFPLDYAVMFCEDRSELPGNITFQDNLLHILLSR